MADPRSTAVPDDRPPPLSPQAEALQAEMRARRREGMGLQALVGASAGALIGPAGGGLVALLLAGFLVKWAGPFGGAAAALVAGGALLLVVTGSSQPLRSTLLWLIVGVALWAVIWGSGTFFFGWAIGESLLAWALGGAVVTTPGAARVLAIRFARGLNPRAKLPWYLHFLGILLVRASELFSSEAWKAGAAGALTGALGGAVGGAISGGAFGAFSGDLGVETFHGVFGAVIGGAILGAVGGAIGGAEALVRLPADETP